MPVVKLGFSANEEFAARLDRAVMTYRRANPERNCSRSSFIKDAITRAIAEIDAGPKGAVRERTRPVQALAPVRAA